MGSRTFKLPTLPSSRVTSWCTNPMSSACSSEGEPGRHQGEMCRGHQPLILEFSVTHIRWPHLGKSHSAALCAPQQQGKDSALSLPCTLARLLTVPLVWRTRRLEEAQRAAQVPPPHPCSYLSPAAPGTCPMCLQHCKGQGPDSSSHAGALAAAREACKPVRQHGHSFEVF